MNKITGYWYKVCPLCHNQGRLVIHTYVDYDELFFVCDECMACWKNAEDVELKRNTFREFNIKSEYQLATKTEIARHGWQIYQCHEYSN